MKYPGGKNAPDHYRQIINQMEPHDLFVEGFGGSAAVTFYKRAAAKSFVIEIDAEVCAAAQLRATARTTAKFLCGDVLQWLGPESWLRAEINRHGKRALCYFDPPYLMEVRTSQRELYDHEFHTEAEHAEFLKLARSLPCRVIISHYQCPQYDRALSSWRRVEFVTGSRGGAKTESLYCNFPAPTVLHDYRFAGANKDRRQRVKRRIETLLRELAALPAVEAHAVVFSLASRFPGPGAAGAVDGNCQISRQSEPTAGPNCAK